MKKLLKLLTVWDMALALTFLAIAAAVLIGCAAGVREPGAAVTVTRDGQVVAEYPLNEDAVIPLEWQGHHNLLVIQDGEASITEADCPDGYCMRQGPVSRQRQTIVCLPARLVITVTGAGEEGLDAVSH